MKGQEEKIIGTIENPEFVIQEQKDRRVLIYFRFYESTPAGKKYLSVVVKILNNEGFIMSAYFTNRIKKGVKIWPKN